MRGLPEPGQDVFVIAPSGASLGARVVDVAEAATVLAFLGSKDSPVAELAGGSVAIQYTNRRGVCRIDGIAGRGDDSAALRVDHTGRVTLIQRREFVRVDAIVPVTYQPAELGGWTGVTTTVNVSGGGFMVSGREGLELGGHADFTLQLEGKGRNAGPLEVSGEVVRETRAGLGVRFLAIDATERERVVRWVFARERLSRKIVRSA